LMKSLVNLISSSGTTNPLSPFAAAMDRPSVLGLGGIEEEGWLSVCVCMCELG
jgi:hypothetical protein